MAEKQITEYKSSWRDEYLAWICGYANANGGTLYIGLDDDGKVVGLSNSAKLMEDIPNKIVSTMGIIADVNLYEPDEGDYIAIIVEPHPTAINYRGHYHYRSGSTKQEIKGAALNRFILKKQGLHWDAVLIPNVSVSDLKKDTLLFFRNKGFDSGRLEEKEKDSSDEVLIENLDLIKDGHLKRAAIMLFYPNPEKYVTGAYIKIGYFGNGEEVIFQDEVHGNLFEQVEKTMDFLFTKYTKALISYEGIHRIETTEYPRDGVREALLNSISHKLYEAANPIQIKVYNDRLVIWNSGEMPDDWTIDTLFVEHASKPYNPDIANAFFRSGYIEAWGQGIAKIFKECEVAGLPKPLIEYRGGDYRVEFRKDIYNEEYLQSIGISERQIKALLYAKENGKLTNSDYQTMAVVSRETATRDIRILISKGLLVSNGRKGAGAFYFTK
jgi:ATP-dependent DNA helicase RecG